MSGIPCSGEISTGLRYLASMLRIYSVSRSLPMNLCRIGWCVPVRLSLIHICIVIQGHTRDYGEIQKAGGAVFSLGQAIGSSPTNFRATKETVNIPVAVGGVVVRPGDYIFGDIDGVMVIPYEHVDKVLEQALLYMEWEAKIEVAIKKGLNAQEMKKVYQEIRFIDEN